MIWKLLGTLIATGGTLLAGYLQREEAGELQKSQKAQQDKLFGAQQQQQGFENRMAQQQLGLSEKSLALQASESKKSRAERKRAMDIQSANNVLGTLGLNTDLQDRVRSMWSQMGIVNQGVV